MKRILIAIVLAAWLAGCAPGGDAPAVSDPAAMPENPYAPQPGDADRARGPVYLDAADLLIMESYPLQIAVSLQGSLPTPCHQLRAAIAPPDADRRIAIEVYSVSDPAAICAQMLQPLEAILSLGSFPAGHYTVLLNGEAIGEFDA